jgi:hypothetical protein
LETQNYEIVCKLSKFGFLTLSVFIIITYLLSLPIGINLLFLNENGILVSSTVLESIPTSFFIFFSLNLPISISKGVFFFILISIYAICFVFAWFLRVNFHSILSRGLSISVKGLFSNFLIMMPFISSTLLLSVVAIQSIQEIYGVETGSIVFQNQFEGLFLLAYSPILEEVSYRITPIGLVLLISILLKMGKEGNFPSFTICVLSFLYPEKAKEKANMNNIQNKGLKEGLYTSEWFILLFSSIFFGINHYLTGGSWGIGKITSAALAGFIFGMTYLYYGIHAPILLHWSFNYYLFSYEILANNYGGIFASITDLNQILIIMLGSFGMASLLFLFMKKFKITSKFEFLIRKIS